MQTLNYKMIEKQILTNVDEYYLYKNKNIMEYFDLKKFLVENKLTNNSREITESKQVGTVYHFTSLSNLDTILTKGLAFNEDNQFTNNLIDPKKKYSISVTRSPNFGKSDPYGYLKKGCRLTLDGDKISQRYKIQPINIDNTWMGNDFGTKKDLEYYDTKFGKFYEERIYSATLGHLPIDYIKQIDVTQKKWDKLSPEYTKILATLSRNKIPINIVNRF
jgi:hypothetical protein